MKEVDQTTSEVKSTEQSASGENMAEKDSVEVLYEKEKKKNHMLLIAGCVVLVLLLMWISFVVGAATQHYDRFEMMHEQGSPGVNDNQNRTMPRYR